MSLRIRDIRCSHQGHVVLDGIDLDVADSGFLGLLGPNGSGKSTLLRVLAGLHRPDRGEVLLDGAPLTASARQDVARRVALLAQDNVAGVDMTVLDVVLLARIPHRDRWGRSGADDVRHAETALADLDVAHLRGRRWSTLSGGERQRVSIARTLAQDAPHLLLDEPTNHLDIGQQLHVLQLLAASPGTVVAALHDINLAVRYCDTVALLHGGSLRAVGSPAEVLTAAALREVYGVEADVVEGPRGTLRLDLHPSAAVAHR
ncbi:ABC transporter ATP-binding protein [Pseudonocardia sp. KRD291]|uniref:ABC transporter ATP-binding protein n=1 Tax=Pseudonocardia sp. KRD291 TaxID=2792007 RepID=UPI0027E2A787|nr:ABC transporter ATP-binding protein [Pseudonocardia sp. KRD291]